MFDTTIKNMLEGVWPMLFIVLTIAISLRIAYLIISKPKFELYKELLMLLFIVYILCLFYHFWKFVQKNDDFYTKYCQR